MSCATSQFVSENVAAVRSWELRENMKHNHDVRYIMPGIHVVHSRYTIRATRSTAGCYRQVHVYTTKYIIPGILDCNCCWYCCTLSAYIRAYIYTHIVNRVASIVCTYVSYKYVFVCSDGTTGRISNQT